jgi:hypothetical protein
VPLVLLSVLLLLLLAFFRAATFAAAPAVVLADAAVLDSAYGINSAQHQLIACTYD